MSRPPHRRGPGRVSVQVARPGGTGADEAPTRGRHRSPDTAGDAPVLAASSLVGAPRHRRARPDTADAAPGPAGLPARSLERVDAAREAASRPATAPVLPVPTTDGAGRVPTAPTAPAPTVDDQAATDLLALRTPPASAAGRTPAPEEAVTDLVARPGRGALPEGPGTGPHPAVLGCAVSVVALVASVVAAAVPASGGSHVTLYGTLLVALLGTATSALGLHRRRPRRALAATGVVVGAAAVVAGVIPLLTL